MRQTKEQYYQTLQARIKATKDQRARERQLGLTHTRRLAFARDIIYGRGYTFQSLAEKIPFTAQALSYSFSVQDDCYLDRLQDILAAVGVSCTVSLKLNRLQDTSTPTLRYRYSGNVVIPQLLRHYPRMVSENPKESRLHFLAEFITNTQLPFAVFCKRSGYSERSFTNFFRSDRIKVSFICQIAERFDAEIVWNLNEI